MILVDYREKPGKREKSELIDIIRRFGCRAEKDDLPFGDVAFDGYDSKGIISVGVERKTLGDLNMCVEDSRLSAHQRIGMQQLYTESYLLVEGVWRPHDPRGLLMQGDDRGRYWEFRPSGRPVLYSKIRRYLFSLQRAGLPVLHTRDITHTAYDICELYRYYQKRDHTAMLEKQKANIPALTRRPPLVQRWAAEIDGIGVKKAVLAAHYFKTGEALGLSEWEQWATLPGIGVKTAKDIEAQIKGTKK